MTRSRPLTFIVYTLLVGVVLLLCERWYEMTFGIEYRSFPWWIITALDGVPVIVAITVSGNIHQGSVLGYGAGFILQWALLGLLVYAFTWVCRRNRRAEEKKIKRTR